MLLKDGTIAAMNESAGTPDFRFNFEGLSRQPSPYEEVIDDDDDDLTAGGRPLKPSDSFDVIGEDEDVSSKLVFSRRR